MDQNETGCEAPQAPILCVTNCGFYGSAATMNMCSKCYKDVFSKQEQDSSIQSIMKGSYTPNVALITTTQAAACSEITPLAESSSATAPASEKIEEAKQVPKRCGMCRKRVGLTGFNCRCGSTFCSVHRYSDKHDCTFDYRSAGQEAIAKANPVVKGEKLDKI